MNTLYLQKTGMDRLEGKEGKQLSDIGSWVVRCDWESKEFGKMHGTFSSWTSLDLGKCTHPIINPNALSHEFSYDRIEDGKFQGSYRFLPEQERGIYDLGFSYTTQGILDWINQYARVPYDTVKVLECY